MKAKKTLFMETTEVIPERTAAEITACLISAGANQIATSYDKGEIVGLRWLMRLPDGRELMFAMPARVDPIYQILRERKGFVDKIKRGYDPATGAPLNTEMYTKARRVAWRQLLRWVQAQCAMIDCGMAKAQEVFFPYVQAPNGQTLFEYFEGQGFKALPAPDLQ